MLVQTIHTRHLNNGVQHCFDTVEREFIKNGWKTVALVNKPENLAISLTIFETIKLFCKADLIISHSEYKNTWLMLLFSPLKKVIYFRHGSQVKWQKEFLIWLFRGIRISVSERSSKFTIKGKNSHVLHPPVYTEQTVIKWENKENKVIFAGTFNFQKGIDLFISAAALMPDIEFVACGGTCLDLSKYVLPNNLIIKGFLDRVTLHNEINNCKVMVVPSRPTEGCPVIVTEGLLLGCHLVGSSELSVVEAINNCGTIFKEGDVQELVKAIKHALVTKPYVNAVEITVARHSPEHIFKYLTECA